MAGKTRWSREPVSEHTPPRPADRTLRWWIFQRIFPDLYLLAPHRKAHLARPEPKYPPAGALERYRDVLPLPLAGMFTGQEGRPETIGGDEEPEADAYKGDYQWERHPGPEASAEE